MPRLVTKFKYLKPGAGGRSVGGYARYIATREGAERIDDSHRHAPATQKQQALIEKILRDFPDTKQSHEYRDYQQERTVGNASEFISTAMEEHLDAVVNTMEAALDGMSHNMQQWDEETIRQLVHTVKVISADHIKVFLCNGIEIDQTVNP